MNIAAYCRVSTDKEDQINSLEGQKKFFIEYAAQHGYHLAKLYADEGLSGTKVKNRKQFLEMMADAECGLFDLLVVKDISRFARNTVDLLQNIRHLRELGIETQFLTANMTNMGNSEFVLTMFAALAQEESANTSKRVKFGKRLNAEKGRVPNIVYGYDKIAGDYFNLRINASEASVIGQIYDWYLLDGLGTAKISNLLNQKGEKTKRGCLWSQNAVCRILENELYTGRIINGKEEVTDFLTGKRTSKSKEEWFITERPELRIISDEQFTEANKRKAARHEKFRSKQERYSNQHLLSSLIKCNHCGSSFRRCVRTYKNTYTTWVCAKHNRNAGSCPNHLAIDEADLIVAIEQYFIKILNGRKNAPSIIKAEIEKLYRIGYQNTTQEKELKTELGKLHRTRQKYLDMYTDDLISRDELHAKIDGIREKIELLERRLQILQHCHANSEQLQAIIAAAGKPDALVNLRNATNAQLRTIIDRIEVHAEGSANVIIKSFKTLQAVQTDRNCYDRTQGPAATAAPM